MKKPKSSRKDTTPQEAVQTNNPTCKTTCETGCKAALSTRQRGVTDESRNEEIVDLSLCVGKDPLDVVEKPRDKVSERNHEGEVVEGECEVIILDRERGRVGNTRLTGCEATLSTQDRGVTDESRDEETVDESLCVGKDPLNVVQKPRDKVSERNHEGEVVEGECEVILDRERERVGSTRVRKLGPEVVHPDNKKNSDSSLVVEEPVDNPPFSYVLSIFGNKETDRRMVSDHRRR